MELDAKKNASSTDKNLINAKTEDEFIELINRQLPSSLELIVFDINKKNKNFYRYRDILRQQNIDFTKCTFNGANNLGGEPAFCLIFNSNICLGSTEFFEYQENVVQLLAKTNNQFLKLSIYKFLMGVSVLYLGKFTKNRIISDAMHKASSYVLKLFNQTTISQNANHYNFNSKKIPRTIEDLKNNEKEIKILKIFFLNLTQQNHFYMLLIHPRKLIKWLHCP